MALSMEVAHRPFLQCLQGLYKKNFDAKASSQALTLEDLASGLLSQCEATMATSFLATLEKVLLTAAKEQWDLPQLDQKLSDEGLSQDHRELFGNWWRQEEPKIYDVLCERSRFDGKLAKLSWRVDVKSSSRDQAEMHEPTAIMELTTEEPLTVGGGGGTRTALFEMSREEVGETLKTLRHISQLMASHT